VWLRRVELTDFRSYQWARLDLADGVTVLVGPNGQGKTNLLEAVHRVASGSSHRAATDAPLVRTGADTGFVRCELETDERRRRTVELSFGAQRQIQVDGQPVRRASDAVGVLRAVLFSPEDLAIVRGDPAERRRFLDDLLAQRRPAFAAARAEYERVLRQRNRLLKQMRGLDRPGRAAAASTLDAWTAQLTQHATQITAARIAAVRTLDAPVGEIYRRISGREQAVGMSYDSAAAPITALATDPGPAIPDAERITTVLAAALGEARDEEVRRGVSLVGPHRDDVALTIGGLPARGYASHGEAWSLALALRLATCRLLADVGDRPVVLLDDVFAELDQTRRRHLAEACADFDQVLVSAAVEEDVPLDGARIDVRLADGTTELVPRVAGDRP
jgi:DNA replication and repair protein RecF